MTGVDVAVFGAANVDLIVRVPQLPVAGETVFGSGLVVRPGGKGLNQALAVAREGGRAALAVTVGDDPWGQLLRDALQRAGVDVSAMYLFPGATTGAALVHVPPDGDSAVVLAPNATRDDPGALDRARAILASVPVAVVQLQLATGLVTDVVAVIAGRVIGTLVPFGDLPAAVWTRLDPLVVNAAEAGTLLDIPADAVSADPVRAAGLLLARGPRSVVVTDGASGAVWAEAGRTGVAAAEEVPVIDTTGAGDATLGALALALAQGHDLRTATQRGVRAGTAAVQRLGA